MKGFSRGLAFAFLALVGTAPAACTVDVHSSECTCPISMNNAETRLACGEATCINGERFACDLGGSPIDEGPCSNVVAQPVADPRGGADGGSPSVPGTQSAPLGPAGMDVAIDSAAPVHLDEIHGDDGGGEFAAAASSPTATALTLDIPSLRTTTPFSVPRNYSCNVVPIRLVLAVGSQSYSPVANACAVTITSWDGTYAKGTISDTTLSNATLGEKKISATFVVKTISS